MLGSAGLWSFVLSNKSVGLRRARSARRLHFFFFSRRFLFHFPSSCYVAIIAHAHAARRDVTRRAVTTAIETVAVIATGGRPIARRGESSDLRRRSGGATRCSAVTRDGGRRWLRDDGRGGARSEGMALPGIKAG